MLVGDTEMGLNPILLLQGHVEGDALDIAFAFLLNLLVEDAQALLGPDGVQDALAAGGGARGAQLRREDGGEGVKQEGRVGTVSLVSGRVGKRDDGRDGDMRGEEEVKAAGVVVGLFIGGEDSLLAFPGDVPGAGGGAVVLVLPFDHQDLGTIVGFAGFEFEAG